MHSGQTDPQKDKYLFNKQELKIPPVLQHFGLTAPEGNTEPPCSPRHLESHRYHLPRAGHDLSLAPVGRTSVSHWLLWVGHLSIIGFCG